jgi:hypothetical protein
MAKLEHTLHFGVGSSQIQFFEMAKGRRKCYATEGM